MSLTKRKKAAERYRPSKVKLLIVAEAPPCATDRYFYFEDVDQHDWLYRYVWEGLTGEKPDKGEKAQHLAALRDAGVYLIDLHEDNVSKPGRKQLEPEVEGLIARCRALEPKHVVLIKSIVYDVSYEPLVEAKLPVIDAKIPFPASGQQKKFLKSFGEAVEGAGVTVR